jgi:hypothetical protein
MAKRGRQPKGGRVTPKGTRPLSPRGAARPVKSEGEPSLVDDVRAALASPHPLALLQLVSALLSLDDEQPPHPPRGSTDDRSPAREEMVSAFLEYDQPETSAVLAVIAGLSDDEVERRRIRRVLALRQHSLPPWIGGLDDAEPEGAVRIDHVLGDGSTIIIGLRLPGGHPLSAVVYLDHNLGTLVKDAFVVPDGPENLVAIMRARLADPDTTFTEVDLAQARTTVADAIALGSITVPPFETETWPGSKPLVLWALRHLPHGGTGQARLDWDDEARVGLRSRFMASPFAEGLDAGLLEQRVEPLIWFGCDYGIGDPLRLSPARIELLLVDWIPRKIVADVDLLSGIPDVLRAFIRFGHDELGIRSELTAETLVAVDEWEPTFQSAIRSPRLQGAEALFEAMNAYDPERWPDVRKDEP